MNDYVYFVVNVLVMKIMFNMMECDHDILKKIRDYYISQIVKINSAMAILPSDLFFKYCILCIDMNIVPLVATWIKRCNEAHTHTNNNP